MSATYPDNLNRIPNGPVEKELFRWADYVELLCLSNPDGVVSDAEVYAMIRHGNDLQADTEQENSRAHTSDRWESRLNDYYRILSYRREFFDAAYPFELSGSNTLTRKALLTEKQYLYIFLLFASNLSYHRENQKILTDTFELVSLEAIKKIMPMQSEVHLFGTSRTDSRYAGDVYTRICRLGEDLRAQVLCNESHFSGNTAGDGGLDIVGWKPFKDQAPGMPVVLSQCACSKDMWKSKQSSIHHTKWDNRLLWTTPFSPVMCVPFSFRKATGLWENSDDIEKTLLIDRDRIINLLEEEDCTFFTGSEAYPLMVELAEKRLSA